CSFRCRSARIAVRTCAPVSAPARACVRARVDGCIGASDRSAEVVSERAGATGGSEAVGSAGGSREMELGGGVGASSPNKIAAPLPLRETRLGMVHLLRKLEIGFGDVAPRLIVKD